MKRFGNLASQIMLSSPENCAYPDRTLQCFVELVFNSHINEACSNGQYLFLQIEDDKNIAVIASEKWQWIWTDSAAYTFFMAFPLLKGRMALLAPISDLSQLCNSYTFDAFATELATNCEIQAEERTLMEYNWPSTQPTVSV
jgi:hypothetical protein